MATYNFASYLRDPWNRRLSLRVDWESMEHTELKFVEYRSRGKHDPGDGEYIHHTCKGGEYFLDVAGDRCIFAGSFAGEGTPYDGALTDSTYYGGWSDGRYYVCQLGMYGSRFACSCIGYVVKSITNRYNEYLTVQLGRLEIWRDLFPSAGEARAAAAQFADRVRTTPAEALKRETTYFFYRVKGTPEWRSPRLTDAFTNTSLRIENHDDTFAGVNHATAQAYIKAFDSLPDLTHMNNIANAMDLVRTFASFARGYVPVRSFKSLAKNAWLGYRYGYGCTRADLEEGASVMARLAALKDSTVFRSNSVINWDGWKVRCSIKCEVADFESLYTLAERWGFALSAYNVWDLVPYSFVIDWFADFGGWIEFCETQAASMRLPLESLWFSIEKSITNQDGDQETYYHRFQWDVAPQVALYNSRGASGRTIVKRGFDFAALLL